MMSVGAGVSILIAAACWQFALRRRRRALARDLHELRGSLTAARLAVDLMPLLGLNEPAVCMAASDELERSYHSLGSFERRLHSPLVGARLAALIRGVSSAARLRERGVFEVNLELKRLALIWGEAARRAGRSVVMDCQSGGVRVRGQRRHLTEVVTNLLSNAIRHGAGEITLTSRIRDNVLRIEVSDQGGGLARPVASLTSGRKLGPHGHGLSVAVRAAQKLGGSITSAPSKGGAVLVLEIPAIALPDRNDLAELVDLYSSSASGAPEDAR